jgi:hypothetical protein
MRQALRSLPVRIPPVELTIGLRVMASRERQRFLERRTWRQMLVAWRERASLNTGEMMRSMVLPLAGGVCTAVVLFSTWLVPTYPLQAKTGFDVPTLLTTAATVTEIGTMGLSGDTDAVVDLTVDDQGRMVDYSIVSGAEMFQDARRRHELEILLLGAQFAPATEFGRPMTSKVHLLLSRQIDVKD